MSHTILVTGATGNIGRELVAQLKAAVSADVQALLGRAPIAFERFVADYVDSWR